MSDNQRAAYFDSIAIKWDGWENLPMLAEKLASGLTDLGIGPDEVVLDYRVGRSIP